MFFSPTLLECDDDHRILCPEPGNRAKKLWKAVVHKNAMQISHVLFGYALNPELPKSDEGPGRKKIQLDGSETLWNQVKTIGAQP